MESNKARKQLSPWHKARKLSIDSLGKCKGRKLQKTRCSSSKISTPCPHRAHHCGWYWRWKCSFSCRTSYFSSLLASLFWFSPASSRWWEAWTARPPVAPAICCVTRRCAGWRRSRHTPQTPCLESVDGWCPCHVRI